MGEGIAFALGYGDVAAKALNDAFTRADFSFDTYRDIILADALFKQLEIRTKLARFAYMLKYPWLFRLGWQAARIFVRFTRWRDPNYIPTIPPSLELREVVSAQ